MPETARFERDPILVVEYIEGMGRTGLLCSGPVDAQDDSGKWLRGNYSVMWTHPARADPTRNGWTLWFVYISEAGMRMGDPVQVSDQSIGP